MTTTYLNRRSLSRAATLVAFVVLVAAGCAPPAAVATPAPTAAPASSEPGGSVAPSGSAAAAAPDCGTDPVTLNIYHETISELMPQLSAEFTKQHPNVTFELKSDSFANATA